MPEILLPNDFSFKEHGVYDFDSALSLFDWSLSNTPTEINFSNCSRANYQALSLIVLYSWHLKANNCRVRFNLANSRDGASNMWKLMGAIGTFPVLINEGQNFKGHEFKPLVAIRNQNDFKNSLAMAEKYIKCFDIEYTNTLRYVLTELLYNTQEHGRKFYDLKGQQKRIPSLIQFTWYQNKQEIQFIIADLGIGIKKHLEQTYEPFENDEMAIKKALQPQVSGTFGASDPYKSKDNAGVGLFISSNIVRRLHAEMHIISGNGLVHVSPRDITSTTLRNRWPGTFVLVSVKIEKAPGFLLHNLMAEFRDAAMKELKKGTDSENCETFYISIYNYFGPFAEDKESGISFRNKYILTALDENKALKFDFDNVVSSPHSFLSALLATPVKRLGMAAYKQIRIVNATPEIRETIDYILDENT